jgi:glycosyltransferase involved in cell wall biosynthesis
MRTIYIMIKEYDDNLAKRQPWYSIKKLKSDLEKLNCQIIIIGDMKVVPKDFTGTVIKVFGLRDLWTKYIGKYKLVYLMTFSVYSYTKFLTFDLKTSIKNWRYLDRILLMSLTPKIFLKNTLNKASSVVVISDRSEKFLSKIINTQKYIPFIANNWGNVTKSKNSSSSKITVGYFGPPYLTRSYDGVINFFIWLNKNNQKINQKIITRIDRNDLKEVEKLYTSKLSKNNCKIVSGFLKREELLEELLDIDVLILPFKIVMAELPIVVLEALELGIPVITTEDSGIADIAKNQTNVLMLKNFKKNKYNLALNFIENYKNDDFNKIQTEINHINANTLKNICKL